jgi:hypothetical protein
MDNAAMNEGDRCLNCFKRIKYKQGARPRQYCDDACRQAAYRRRQRNEQLTNATEHEIAALRRSWASAGYPDDLVEQLVVFYHDYGEKGYLRIQPILLLMHDWAVRRTTELIVNRNEP